MTSNNNNKEIGIPYGNLNDNLPRGEGHYK